MRLSHKAAWWSLLTVIAMLSAVLGGAQAVGAASFTTIDVPGAVYTQAFGINKSGDIVGGYGTTFTDSHGFLLSGGSFTTFDGPGTFTRADGIDKSGNIVGSYRDANTGLDHGFLRLADSTFTTIDDPDGAQGSRINGINNAGTMVGDFTDAAGFAHGFVLSGGTFTTVDFPGAASTLLFEINNSGAMVGYWEDASHTFHAFEVKNGNFTSIDVPGAVGGSTAGGINAKGEIVGSYAVSATVGHSYFDKKGTFTTIDPPTALVSGLSKINDSADAVGSFFDGVTIHGFLTNVK